MSMNTESVQVTELSVEEKLCFVAMPISDTTPYSEGHFGRVYENIIKPSCEAAGFIPIRADDVQKTNFIMLDIIKYVVNSSMMIADLSGKNPNVMYELGIRQAFNLPVTLVKDESTNRIFDIQTMRDFVYNESLRVDLVAKAIDSLSKIIKATYESHINKSGDINSLIALLGIESASLPQKVDVTNETGLILNSLGDLGRRFSYIEDNLIQRKQKNKFGVGDQVSHIKHGSGTIIYSNGTGDKQEVSVNFGALGVKKLLVKFANLELFNPESVDSPADEDSLF